MPVPVPVPVPAPVPAPQTVCRIRCEEIGKLTMFDFDAGFVMNISVGGHKDGVDLPFVPVAQVGTSLQHPGGYAGGDWEYAGIESPKFTIGNSDTVFARCQVVTNTGAPVGTWRIRGTDVSFAIVDVHNENPEDSLELTATGAVLACPIGAAL